MNSSWYTLYPFEIKYTGEAESVQRITNKLVTSDLYFILRSVDIENEKTSVPRRSEIISQATSDEAQKNIIPIVGRENIKVSLRIDLLLWDGASKAVAASEGAEK